MGVRTGAVEVLAAGADVGEEEEEGATLEIGYERSLPLDEAMGPGVLLAYMMNGEALTPAHGGPVRLIVPGWYGMASVKWLERIEVLSEPFVGFFQDRRYVFIRGGAARASWEAVSRLAVKSIITRPRHGEVVPPGEYVIEGKAGPATGCGPRGGELRRRGDVGGRPLGGRERAGRVAHVGVPLGRL